MGDRSAAGGTTSRTGPHLTRPASRAIVARSHRPGQRRSAVADRTPVPLLALTRRPHPRVQDASPRPSPPTTVEVPHRRRRTGTDRRVDRGVPARPGRGGARMGVIRSDPAVRSRRLTAIGHPDDDRRGDRLLSEPGRHARELGPAGGRRFDSRHVARRR